MTYGCSGTRDSEPEAQEGTAAAGPLTALGYGRGKGPMIRAIFDFLYFVFFLIIGIFMQLVVLIVGLFDKGARDRLSMRYVQWGFRCVQAIAGIKVSAEGRENIPTDRASLLVCNHRSIFDIILSYPLMPIPTGYLAKKELRKVPLLRGWMIRIRCLFLDRSDPRQGMQTILAATELVKSGISFFVFPEGTRNHEEGTVLPFHAATLRIATKSGTPIVPVCAIGTGAVFEDHSPRVTPGHVTFIFGEPIETKDMSREEIKELPERIRTWILEQYKSHTEDRNDQPS